MRHFSNDFQHAHWSRGLAAITTLACAAVAMAQAPAASDQDAKPAPRDRYLFKIAPQGDKKSDAKPDAPTPPAPPASGRIVLFFVPDTARWASESPVEGPFFQKLQPIASVAVPAATDGATITLDDTNATTFGGPLDLLDGAWRVQAVLDTDFTERGHVGPGDILSEPVRIELSPDRADEIRIELVHRVEAATPPATPGVEWIERKSALLSKHFRRDVNMRAGVVLPFGYDDLSYPRRMWPTIYVISGFGGNHLDAASAAAALRSPDARVAIPQAVWVFLDAETAWGHHGFCDSETNGPVGKALVEEFVPFLEERFRLISKPEARIVTGHSSGGWTSVHLALAYPATFGACFASSPDPVDFSAFQRTDIYREASLFIGGDGSETPSYRGPLGPNEDRVFMTVRDEVGSEHAIDPNGRSGEQWAAWDAMWSPYDPAHAAPRRLCDPTSGAIDPVTVEAWSRHDIAKLFERDPARVADLFATRIRLVCGTRDSYYLNEAVERLKGKLEAWRTAARARGDKPADGPGYIELLDGLTHDTAYSAAQLRFHRGIVEHLRDNGLADAIPGRKPDPRPDPRLAPSKGTSKPPR